jgi:hypothetical protein
MSPHEVEFPQIDRVVVGRAVVSDAGQADGP